MAWEDEIFAFLADLEQQADALYDAERAPELADRSRAEYQQVTLATRLMASLDRDLALTLSGVGPVAGRLARVGTGWCLLQGAGQDWVVRTACVLTVRGASERALPEVAWSAVARLGVGSVLRRLAEAGERCAVHLVDGSRLEGVPHRVGHDFLELAAGEQGRVSLVAFTALAAVQSRP